MFKKKLSTIALFGAIALSAASCGGGNGGGGAGGNDRPKPGDMLFWHNFGGEYTNTMEKTILSPLYSNDGYNLEGDAKGGYDGLVKEINMTLADRTFPNIATGYPDHFAGYAHTGFPLSRTGVLANMNTFLNDPELNAAHQAKYGTSIRDDYYPEYMVENDSISYDESGNAITVGLPFNKSTEVLGYNYIFVEYAKTVNSSLHVPTTWDEMKLLGPKFREIQMSLNGKWLTYNQVDRETYNNFAVVDSNPGDSVKYLDFHENTNAATALMCWDSLENMFITLVRQFGSTYTSYLPTDRTGKADEHGYMEFYTGDDNKAKTVQAMQLVRDLYGTSDASRLFAPASFFGAGSTYGSDAFKKNKVMFNICSTGGLTHNMDPDVRFESAPIPYQDASKKFVISQGANLTIFDRNSVSHPEKYASIDEFEKECFKAVVKMTTGDYQAEWAVQSGYYPASKSATNSQIYQNFINGDGSQDTDLQYAIRKSCKLNQDEYMNASKNWQKFVDPGFNGSNVIRSKVGLIISDLTNKPSLSIDEILTGYYTDNDLKMYVRS